MLLVEADSRRRQELVEALVARGLGVTAVGRIAEVERWPFGEIVIVDAAHFTPWWLTVGATRVIVQVDTPDEGAALCARGAAGWVSRSACPADVVAALFSVGTSIPA